MGSTRNHRTPKATAEEPSDRTLTPEQKRELTIDIMASWALDGLHPTRETVENINAFLASGLTASEYIQTLKEKWSPAEDA
jgi:hypothetical protein